MSFYYIFSFWNFQFPSREFSQKHNLPIQGRMQMFIFLFENVIKPLVFLSKTLKTRSNKASKSLETIWEDRSHREDSGKRNNVSVRPVFEG